jgi:hypothetical protein
MSLLGFFREWMRNLHVIFALVTLLGVYFIFLGISLAGLVSALRKQEKIMSNHHAVPSPPQDESI